MTQPCKGPATLPDAALTQADVVSFWLADRAALTSCGERFVALTDWYQQRDSAIGGQ